MAKRDEELPEIDEDELEPDDELPLDDDIDDELPLDDDDDVLDEDVLDDDEVPDEDDVVEDDGEAVPEEDDDQEASLEALIAQRATGLDDDDEDEEDLIAEIPDASVFVPEDVIPPRVKLVKDEGEFVCARCHLVKKKVQLADPDKGYCRDCA